MKALVPSGFAFALLAGTALAQQAPSDHPQPEQAATEQQDAGGPPPPPSEEHDGWSHSMDGHHHRPQSKAAAFRIEAGDLRIGMKCPDDEPLKACADFTLQLLDKLGSVQRR